MGPGARPAVCCPPRPCRSFAGVPSFAQLRFLIPDSVSSHLPKESVLQGGVSNAGRIGGRLLGPIFGCGLILECAPRSSDKSSLRLCQEEEEPSLAPPGGEGQAGRWPADQSTLSFSPLWLLSPSALLFQGRVEASVSTSQITPGHGTLASVPIHTLLSPTQMRRTQVRAPAPPDWTPRPEACLSGEVMLGWLLPSGSCGSCQSPDGVTMSPSPPRAFCLGVWDAFSPVGGWRLFCLRSPWVTGNWRETRGHKGGRDTSADNSESDATRTV